ncbi:hypothetical protein BJ138DRAFT_352382 [Hygrophoropsis aurantiaca]|uniref:Uncharacterized protein n=1 Tax=Hygrophoropsis aurantiaca TaxID=72124 RepID=A0ACB8A6V7_9AGAM|nr:hypothetical protein BJ138DRAFT_352382 [Hygrophoropsis aurantiaca]
MTSSRPNSRELKNVILASDFKTITWTTKTTTVEETVTITRNTDDPVVRANRAPTPPRSPTNSLRRASIAASTVRALSNSENEEYPLVPDPTYIPSIPHPNNIEPPAPGLLPEAYYVITVGQEVGVFFLWADVAERTHNISGSVQSKFRHFEKAKAAYTKAYNSGTVHAVPVYGGPFWRMRAVSPPPTPSPSTSSSDGSLWDRVDDLSTEMSQVSL